MRSLLVLAAGLVSFALTQSGTQVDPTLEDLARLMGDVVVIEVAVPENARTVRIAETMGERGHTESYSRIDGSDERVEPRIIRFLIKTPGHLPVAECSSERIDVHLVWPDGKHSSASGSCVPPPAGEPALSQAKHEHVLTGSDLELGVWSPIYLRGWTWVRAGSVEEAYAARYPDTEHVFPLQVMFLEEEIEDARGGPPPLDAEALRRLPELAWYVAPPRPAAPSTP